MPDRKSIYTLNKKDPEAIVYTDADRHIIRLKLTVPVRTRLTPSLFGAFCPLSLGGRQPACVSQDKNPAKIVHCEVPCSFDGAVFRQGKEGTADNTCRIIKGPDAELAENCPSKPGSYRHRQLTRADFDTEAGFLKWKAWSDENYHDEEKGDHVEDNHTAPLNEKAGAADGPEVTICAAVLPVTDLQTSA